MFIRYFLDRERAYYDSKPPSFLKDCRKSAVSCFPFPTSCAMTSDSIRKKEKKMETKQTSGGRGTFELVVQLITAAAVLIGIYFVMVELRQGREISTVEMVHTRLITQIEHDARVYGENLAVTLAKACHSPEDLNNSEVVVLNKYFETQMNQMSVAYTGAIIGSFQKVLGLLRIGEY